MRVARVLGSVTLSSWSAELAAGRYVLVQPLSAAALAGTGAPDAETLVAYDGLGVSPGATVAISEGREASMPFYPAIAPVDAYCAALLDEVVVAPEACKALEENRGG